MQRFDLVVFDMDGVLVDSHPIYKKADLEVLPGVGLDMALYDQRRTFGLRVPEIAQLWIDVGGLSIARDELVEKMNAKVFELIELEATPMKGVRELLSFLETVDIKCSIASTAPKEMIKAMVKAMKIANHFQEFFTSEDCEYGKPHPQVFIDAIEHFDVEPSKTLIIEDSLNGVQAAKSAGATCIAVPEPQLRSHVGFQIADYVVSDLFEAIDILRDSA